MSETSTRRRQRATIAFGAVLSAALLLNVFALAPAFHDHGSLHDAQSCVICLFQATGSVAPPVTAELPSLAVIALQLSPLQPAPPTAEHALSILVRGPPIPTA